MNNSTLPRLFTPTRIGAIDIANRVVMAPLTRCRGDESAGDVSGRPMNVQYYTQRAGAGLIISEGTQISPTGKGYMATPGIYSADQVAGWRRVTDAVHAAGSKIIAQIWHVGRISHPDINGGHNPIGPSAIAPGVAAYGPKGKVDCPVPVAMDETGIATVVAEFANAARNARSAGFDGVEIHGANGYLVDQFLRDGSNQRTDRYGGSPENRRRFALEVVDACIEAIGADRVGIRLSPVSSVNGIHDSAPQSVFGPLVEALDQRGIAFIHFVEGTTGGSRDLSGFDFSAARKAFRGAYIANNGYTRELALSTIDSGAADAIAFGRPFIANPDLVARLMSGAALASPDPQTFYAPTEHGYTDYPTL
jgi:N-ethylmaleimide reductase